MSLCRLLNWASAEAVFCADLESGRCQERRNYISAGLRCQLVNWCWPGLEVSRALSLEYVHIHQLRAAGNYRRGSHSTTGHGMSAVYQRFCLDVSSRWCERALLALYRPPTVEQRRTFRA